MAAPAAGSGRCRCEALENGGPARTIRSEAAGRAHGCFHSHGFTLRQFDRRALPKNGHRLISRRVTFISPHVTFRALRHPRARLTVAACATPSARSFSSRQPSAPPLPRPPRWPQSSPVVNDAPIAAMVVIRTYQGSLVASATRLSALAVAGGILRAAGLAIEWRMCEEGTGQNNSDPCAEALGPNELMIRFLRRPLSPDKAGQVPLGTSVIDTHRAAGSLATIYVDRVASLARDSRTDIDTLLGRAIAHEVGHLLLGTTSHTPTGLMRAVWSTPALRAGAREWLFTPGDARSMRDALFFDRH